MGVLVVFCEAQGELSPIEIGPSSDVQNPISRGDNLMLLLNLVETYCIRIFVFFIALDGVQSTYFRATNDANSS
jgi:hypothetical protein